MQWTFVVFCLEASNDLQKKRDFIKKEKCLRIFFLVILNKTASVVMAPFNDSFWSTYSVPVIGRASYVGYKRLTSPKYPL